MGIDRSEDIAADVLTNNIKDHESPEDYIWNNYEWTNSSGRQTAWRRMGTVSSSERKEC